MQPGSALRLIFSWAGLSLFFASGADFFHSYIDAAGRQQMVTTSVIASRLPFAALIIALLLAGAILAGRFLIPRGSNGVARKLSFFLLPYSLHFTLLLRFWPGLHQFNGGLLLLSTTLQPLLFLLITTVQGVRLIPAGAMSIGNRAGEDHSRLRQVIFVFFCSAIVLLFLLPGFLERELFSGDQPHYLLVTHSLLEDGDIAFGDEYEDRIYRRYDPIPDIEPQSLRNDRHGNPVPFHRIGLSLLAVPFYAIGGVTGAVIMVILLAAGSAALLYYLLRHWGAPWHLAAVLTMWTLGSIPLFNLSLSFMTEVPLLFFILLVAVLLIRLQLRPASVALLLVFIWWLPWMHTRGFPIAIFLAIATIWLLRRRLGLLLSFCALSLPLSLSTLYWNYLVYGDFSLIAQMPAGARKELAFTNIFTNVPALLFDSRYGAVLHNPAILVALAGVLFLWKWRRNLLIPLVGYSAFALGPALLYHHWWGGMSPARYLAVLMPVAAVLLLAVFAAGGIVLRRIAVAAMILAMILGLLSVIDSPVISSLRTGPPALLNSVSFGEANAAALWPSWFDSRWFYLHALILAVLLTAIWPVLGRVGKGEGRAMAAWTAGILVFILWSPVSGHFSKPGAGSFVSREQHDYQLYQRYRNLNGTVIQHNDQDENFMLPPLGYSAIRLFGREHLRGDELAPRGRYFPLERTAGVVQIRESHPLWAGNWQLRVCVATPGEGELGLTVSDISTRAMDAAAPVVKQRLDTGPDYRVFTFPVRLETNSWGLELSFERQNVRFAYAELLPDEVRRIDDWTGPQQAFNMTSLRYNTFVLFMEQGATHMPDGRMFWTQANAAGRYWIKADSSASSVQLRLRGGNETNVTIRIDDETLQKQFDSGNSTMTIDMPAGFSTYGDALWFPFELEVEGRFIPLDKADRRRLGTHTAVRLQR